MKRVHVVGAGLAGLSAAVRLAEAGAAVALYESAPQAGGRCRSWYDAQLGLTIDNGNHLVLSGNRAVMDYTRLIGAEDRLIGPDKARFEWLDMRDGERWTLRPNDGVVPWWLLRAGRRVPGSSVGEYGALARLLGAGTAATVGETIRCEGPLWERLIEPFLVSALNAPARLGSARLAGAVIRGSLARGGRAARPRVAHPTLAAAFVDPALGWLAQRGASVTLGRRLRAIGFADGRAASLDFGECARTLDDSEAVVLALPAWGAQELLPGLSAPTEHNAIVNAHFAVVPPTGASLLTGLVGGAAEWVFALPDRVSTTTSAAERLVGEDRAVLARRLWADAARALGMAAGPVPPHRIVAEKRATFAATPAQDALRPGTATQWRNLFLAGDWTQTGLPATIEGALASGVAAARLALRCGNA
jgi:squalene-associated FAD-dependent desaturase